MVDYLRSPSLFRVSSEASMGAVDNAPEYFFVCLDHGYANVQVFHLGTNLSLLKLIRNAEFW